MSKENRDYLDMSFRSIACFADDGKLMPNELDELLEIALRDGEVDENEKRVLRNIFSRLTPEELSKEMVERIDEIRRKYDV